MDLAVILDTARTCSPAIHPHTIARVVEGESARRPLAININSKDGLRLKHQPRNLPEAVATARALIERGINFDAGLAQINVLNWQWLKLNPITVFDPCRNLKAAQAVLLECYRRAPSRAPRAAAHEALSCFNTGNHRSGFRNGYVTRIVNAPLAIPTTSPKDSL